MEVLELNESVYLNNTVRHLFPEPIQVIVTSNDTPAEERGGFMTWEEVKTLFANTKVVLPAWVHFVAFDL